METIVTMFSGMSPLAIIAMLGYIIYMLVSHSTQIKTIKNNDLHELPLVVPALEKIDATLQRIEVQMATEFSYLRARMNGKTQ